MCTRAPGSYPRESASPLSALLKTEACWVNLAFLLTFFPSTIFFILPSLSQPVAALAALPLLFLFPTRSGALTRWILILLFLIAFYIVISLFIYPEIAGKILANGASYMLPPLYLLAMQSRGHNVSVRMFRWALWLWLLIGVIQYFGVFTPIQGPLQSVLKVFIADRFLMTHYTGDRGVMFFSTEPSTAAPIILLFILCTLFFWAQRRISRLEMTFSILASLAMAAMNQSGSVALLVLLAVVSSACDWLGALRWRFKVLTVAILTLGIWGVGTLPLALDSDLRAFVVLAQFVRLVDPSRLSARTVIASLSAIGGQRVVPVLQGYGSILDHYGAGHGIASWNIEPVVANVEKIVGISVFDFAVNRGENGIYTPQDPMGQTKPQTFLATIAWDTGVPGLLTSLAVILAVVSVARRQRRLTESRLLFLVPAIFYCAFLSEVPLVAPWLMMVFAMTPGPAARSRAAARASFPNLAN
jgi:hypothetical protein